MIIAASVSVLAASLLATGPLLEQPTAPGAVTHITAPGQNRTVCDPDSNVEPVVLLGVEPQPPQCDPAAGLAQDRSPGVTARHGEETLFQTLCRLAAGWVR